MCPLSVTSLLIEDAPSSDAMVTPGIIRVKIASAETSLLIFFGGSLEV